MVFQRDSFLKALRACLPLLGKIVAADVPSASEADAAPAVYAHFMVGIVESYTEEEWKDDIRLAKETHIDGFALNVGATDSYTETQLDLAYRSAEDVGDFTMFISFDFNAGWGADTAEQMGELISTHASSPAQARYSNKALVSSFASDDFNWDGVRSATNQDLFIIPHTSTPSYEAASLSADGLFNWNAWPSANNRASGSIMTAEKAGDATFQEKSAVCEFPRQANQ